jgi:hypothetical protein
MRLWRHVGLPTFEIGFATFLNKNCAFGFCLIAWFHFDGFCRAKSFSAWLHSIFGNGGRHVSTGPHDHIIISRAGGCCWRATPPIDISACVDHILYQSASNDAFSSREYFHCFGQNAENDCLTSGVLQRTLGPHQPQRGQAPSPFSLLENPSITPTSRANVEPTREK